MRLGKLPHSVTVVAPALVEDSRGNLVRRYDDSAKRSTVRGWLQQDTSSDQPADGRDTVVRRWMLLAVLPGVVIDGYEEVVWENAPEGPRTFRVDGPGEPAYTLRGYSHHEITLRRVDG